MSKIVHICLNGSYTDGFNYQDNILPKYHKLLGLDVTVLAPQWCRNHDGEMVSNYENEYINNDGIKVIRIPQKKKNRKPSYKFKIYPQLYSILSKENPDIIFFHNFQMFDSLTVTKYIKNNREVVLYIDNHSDYSNSASSFISRNILHKLIWKYCAHKILPYTKKFYGVLPARVDFLVSTYGLPKNKCELLLMGADDELLSKYSTSKWKNTIRKRFNVKANDFLIVTGGKIDLFKTQTLTLLEAIKEVKNINIKVIVFGSVVPQLKEQFNSFIDNKNMYYIGWLNAEESYKYFGAADLVVFPGRHSVYWEQVVAQGIPMICKYWAGTTHVDIGGNVRFLYKDTIESIKNELLNIVYNKDIYNNMLESAMGDKHKEFMYSEIAKKSIELY